jgi:hypothetical protein
LGLTRNQGISFLFVIMILLDIFHGVACQCLMVSKTVSFDNGYSFLFMHRTKFNQNRIMTQFMLCALMSVKFLLY